MVNWDDVQRLYNIVNDSIALKIKGEGFQVYKAGTIIRIDIEVE